MSNLIGDDYHKPCVLCGQELGNGAWLSDVCGVCEMAGRTVRHSIAALTAGHVVLPSGLNDTVDSPCSLEVAEYVCELENRHANLLHECARLRMALDLAVDQLRTRAEEAEAEVVRLRSQSNLPAFILCWLKSGAKRKLDK